MRFFVDDLDADDGGTQQSPRFNIAYLIERTKFTRAELIAMYRNFKSTSPNGWMTHERLTIDLEAIFPSGGNNIRLILCNN